METFWLNKKNAIYFQLKSFVDKATINFQLFNSIYCDNNLSILSKTLMRMRME